MKTRKIVVGLALQAGIRRNRLDPTISDLYSNPDPASIASLNDRLIHSKDPEDREVGFWLEPAVKRKPPEIDWRDIVINMLETELDLLDLAYRIQTSHLRETFRVDGLLDWLNEIGNSVNNIRSGDWIYAKIAISRALHKSHDTSIEKIRENEYLTGAIDSHRKSTENYFDQILTFPCKLTMLEDRVDTILEVQDLLIEIMRKYYLESPNRILVDVILYPIEKLGVAQDYLLNPERSEEQANYEIGLASEHLKEKVVNIQNSETLKWAKNIQERIEFLFSKLPAEPWPVKGFGYPGVESRFEKGEN